MVVQRKRYRAFDFSRSHSRAPVPSPEKAGRAGVRSDEDMLEILDRIEGRGMSYAEAGAPYGLTRSAVASIVRRVLGDLALSEVGSAVRRAENRDGALGRRWWAQVRGVA
jgi:hypothetical protein